MLEDTRIVVSKAMSSQSVIWVNTSTMLFMNTVTVTIWSFSSMKVSL